MLSYVSQSHLIHVEPKQVSRTEVFCMHEHAYYEIRTGNNNDVTTHTHIQKAIPYTKTLLIFVYHFKVYKQQYMRLDFKANI
jgi:hypothetical protein